MKNFLKNKMFKRTSLGLLLAIVMIGGVFVYQALAVVNITQATGGEAVSIDTTSNADCTGGAPCGTWTNISGLKITEAVPGDIATGLHTLILPAGWEFDTTQVIQLSTKGTGLALSSNFISPTNATTFNFTVSTASTASDEIQFVTAIRVRPTNKAVATGYLTMSAGTIAGVALNSTPFATLTTVAGTVAKLAVTTQPTNTVYGSAISSTAVNTQDQFGNNSVVGLGDKTVSLVSSAGTLSGTISGAVNSGTITFSDLKIDPVATGYTLTASADGLASATSSAFNITAKPLTISGLTAASKTYDKDTTAVISGTGALETIEVGDEVTLSGTAAGTFDNKNVGIGKTVTVSGLTLAGTNATNYSLTPLTLTADINKVALTVTGAASVSKTYNGNTTATFTGGALDGVLTSETVGLVTAGYSATFDTKNVGTGKTVTISGLTLDDVDAGNYSLTQPSLTDGAITQAAITVTADSSQTKVYGATDPTLTFTTSPALISNDSFTGALARATGETVGTYAINQGSLANANYNITFVPANFAITAKPITVTADSSQTKVYGATDPTLTFTTSPALISNDSFTGALARATGETVGTYAINQGTLANANYTISFTPADFAITAKELTVSGAVVTTKTYNQGTDAVITGATLSGVVGTENVTLENATTGTFASKDVANGISVATLPMTISGADAGNYSLTQPTLTGNITPLQLTIGSVSSITMDKVYDQTTTAAVTPNTLTGVISGDTVGVTAAANYASPAVGTVKAITIVYSLTGANAGNYTKPADAYTGANGSITPIQLTITDPTVTKSKTYDGTTTAAVTAGGLSGVLSGDDVTANAVSSYATKTVEAIKTITTVYSLTGTKAGNYIAPINFSTLDGAIVAKELTVTGSAVTSRVYNGGTDAAITGATLSGAIEGDTVTLGNATTGTFASKDVANGISVATLPMTISGADAGNYSLTQPTLTGNITKATPLVTWDNPADMAAGTALSGTQLNATATGVAGTLAGTFVYNPSASYATDTVGILALDTTFTPIDTTNYNNQTASVEVNIVPAAIAKLTISADHSNLVANENSTITVTGYDQYNNVVTNNSSAVISLSTDNGGSLASALLTLASGVKTTTLSKNSAGVVNVNAVSGVLTPATTPVTFTAVPTDTQAPTISNYSVSSTQTTAGVTFQSDENGRGKVSYSKSGVTPIDTSYISLNAATPATINLAGLTCGATYNYTIYANDSASNTGTYTGTFDTSACTPGDTTPPTAPVITTASSTVNAGFYTISGTVTADAASVQTVRVLVGSEVYGMASIPKNGTTWSVAVSLPQGVSTTFKTTSADEAGNVSGDSNTVVITEDPLAGQGNGILTVDKITPVRTYATAGGGFDQGWSWTFNVTVPTSETSTSLKFADWVSGSNLIPAASNIRFYSAQSSNANSTSTAIIISAANTYSDVMTINGDSDATKEGRQIQITVEAQVPVDNAGGSYSTSYGIKSN